MVNLVLLGVGIVLVGVGLYLIFSTGLSIYSGISAIAGVIAILAAFPRHKDIENEPEID